MKSMDVTMSAGQLINLIKNNQLNTLATNFSECLEIQLQALHLNALKY